MSRREAMALDRALSGGSTPSGEELAAMVAMGDRIRGAYASFTPAHSPERAMFVRAVAEARSPGFRRFVAPATVTAVLLIGLLFLGRTALPGSAFYPVREVLRNVGLAPASVEEVQSLIGWADRLLDQAEDSAALDREASKRLAFEAARVIGMAEGALTGLDVDEQAEVADELGDVLARAKAILTEAPGQDGDRNKEGKAVLRDDDEDDQGGDNDKDGDGDPDDSQDGSSRDRSQNRGNDPGDDKTGGSQKDAENKNGDDDGDDDTDDNRDGGDDDGKDPDDTDDTDSRDGADTDDDPTEKTRRARRSRPRATSRPKD